MDHGYFKGGNLFGAGFVFRWLWGNSCRCKVCRRLSCLREDTANALYYARGVVLNVIEYYARPMLVYTFRHCVGCDKNIKVIILLLSSVAGVKVPANDFLVFFA